MANTDRRYCLRKKISPKNDIGLTEIIDRMLIDIRKINILSPLFGLVYTDYDVAENILKFLILIDDQKFIDEYLPYEYNSWTKRYQNTLNALFEWVMELK